jgi:hypothetical protein
MEDRVIDCPRCLGKGSVDKQDVIRLRQMFFWMPGPICAFCNGLKKVNQSFAYRFNADDWFITTDLSIDDYQKYIDRDPALLAKNLAYEEMINSLGYFIVHYHLKEGLPQEETFFMLQKKYPDLDSEIFLAFLEQIYFYREAF